MPSLRVTEGGEITLRRGDAKMETENRDYIWSADASRSGGLLNSGISLMKDEVGQNVNELSEENLGVLASWREIPSRPKSGGCRGALLSPNPAIVLKTRD
jgi:hypothetical protein